MAVITAKSKNEHNSNYLLGVQHQLLLASSVVPVHPGFSRPSCMFLDSEEASLPNLQV